MLDAGLPPAWPDAVSAATARFLQGHLIERPPLFYTANLAHPVWALSTAAAPDTPEDERVDALVDLAAARRTESSPHKPAIWPKRAANRASRGSPSRPSSASATPIPPCIETMSSSSRRRASKGQCGPQTCGSSFR